MRTISESQIQELDNALSHLQSLGTAISQLSMMECQDPDLITMGDLGKMVAEVATGAVDLIQER